MVARNSVRTLMSIVLLLSVSTGQAGDEVDQPQWIDEYGLQVSITATEVTVAQYRSCVAAGLCEEQTVAERCNYGKVGFDDHPVNCVSHFGAEQYCAAVGGRLCSETEWLEACRGTDNRRFPYGDAFNLETCNSRSTTATIEGRDGTVPAGSLERCEGGVRGLMDMAGNVAEWLADCKGDYCKFRGGGHLSNDPIEYFAGCRGVCSGNQKTLQSGTVGIRCCRDLTSAP